MDIPRHGRQGADAGNFVAAEEVGRLREEAAHSSIERSASSGTRNTGNAIDEAALTLCRLRRARKWRERRPEHGDEAVRQVLGEDQPACTRVAGEPCDLVHGRDGLPRAVEPWFPTDART